MSTLHINEIDELITLLYQYKNELQSKDNVNDENLMTLLSNDIDSIKDKIYLFFSNKKTKITDPKLIEEINEYHSNISFIEELYPIILNYLIYKDINN